MENVCANKMKRIAENMNSISCVFVQLSSCCCCCCCCFTTAFVSYGKSKGNNNASHLAWCVIRNVAISFTHLASCINAIAICCAILSTHWCLCVSQRWSTCTSTPKQKRTMNKKYTQRQQRWAPKYLVPMPHVYAFLLFTTTNAYTWRYILGEVNRFLVSTFTPFALSRSMVSQMEKKETRTHHCLGCVLLSLRNACFGFNSDQVSW